jgi:ribosomal protein S21
MPVTVKARGNDSTDSVVRKFKRKVLTEDVLGEARKREFHVTDAMKRKERKNEIRRKKYVERKQREASNPKK